MNSVYPFKDNFIRVPERGVMCLKGEHGYPCCANKDKGTSSLYIWE